LTAHDALAAHAETGHGITAASRTAPFRDALAALALTGWVSARISQVQPMAPMVRTASIGGLSMLITYVAGHLLHR